MQNEFTLHKNMKGYKNHHLKIYEKDHTRVLFEPITEIFEYIKRHLDMVDILKF